MICNISAYNISEYSDRAGVSRQDSGRHHWDSVRDASPSARPVRVLPGAPGDVPRRVRQYHVRVQVSHEEALPEQVPER